MFWCTLCVVERVFQCTVYVCSVSVSEDTMVGTTLLHVSATDADYTRDNTQIDYSIVAATSSMTCEL